MSLPVVSDSLQLYLNEVNRFPLLTPEEEHTIAVRYYRERNIEDAHRLVVSNLRYVVKIALEYRNYDLRLADLIQEGNIGLMVAVKKFNPYRGVRLITYAAWWIRSFIQEFILKAKGLVKNNSKALKKKLFYRNSASRGSAKDSPEIREVSLDSPVGDDSTTHLDMLPDPGPAPVDAVANREEKAIAKRKIESALSVLSEKERFVIEKRVMEDDPLSLQGIGLRLGLTRERVRQIENEALKKLRKKLSSGSLAGCGKSRHCEERKRLRGEAEANSEIPRYARNKLRNL